MLFRSALLPDGAIFVNAARGAIHVDDDLIEALQSGRLKAAGINDYNNEPTIDPRFAELPNTFLMPHIGSATAETRDAMGFRAPDNLDAFSPATSPATGWTEPAGPGNRIIKGTVTFGGWLKLGYCGQGIWYAKLGPFWGLRSGNKQARAAD